MIKRGYLKKEEPRTYYNEKDLQASENHVSQKIYIYT